MTALSQQVFDTIRRHTPLVSIDLLIEDAAGRVLLGWRINEPAKDSWFVPGGRILKDERLADAFTRVIRAELGDPLALGISDHLADATFVGVYEHLYPATATLPFSVHYIVLAHRVKATRPGGTILPASQHGRWRWATVAEIANDPQVHANTRAYYDRPFTR
jgi:colanic acid biosynthesis protein WcaH